MDGHELYLRLLEKHGKDRYHTVLMQFAKLAEEMGEVARHLLRDSPGIEKEMGDMGLSLYGLAVKLGLNLDECMQAVVEQETRTFSDGG
jgi:NTP pyrophosphatase (non-canonical NTP hydrolase)